MGCGEKSVVGETSMPYVSPTMTLVYCSVKETFYSIQVAFPPLNSVVSYSRLPWTWYGSAIYGFRRWAYASAGSAAVGSTCEVPRHNEAVLSTRIQPALHLVDTR